MANVFQRLWHASPAKLVNATRYHWRHLREGAAWQRVSAGPAKGVEMLLPIPLESWATEVARGDFDAFMYEALAGRRSLAGARCWDVGAHVGYHTLAFANQGAEVVAFEPASANIARLKLHLERNSALAQRIRLMTVALADHDGATAFMASHDLKGESTGSHLVQATPPLGEEAYTAFEQQTVTAVTMDTLIEQRGEPPPDIVKLDVEGAEHLVIQGGLRSLQKHKPLLLVEVHHICVMLPLAEALIRLGYQLEILDRQNASPSRCFVMAT